MDSSADSFESPVESERHKVLRDTAWMGDDYVEGRYLLGMLIGRNLFRVSDESYISELQRFIGDRVSVHAGEILCTLTDSRHLMPFLRKLYECETEYPPIERQRNERVERGIEYLLHNLDASVKDLAVFLKTTEKQVVLLCDLTDATKTIRLHHESTSK